MTKPPGIAEIDGKLYFYYWVVHWKSGTRTYGTSEDELGELEATMMYWEIPDQ